MSGNYISELIGLKYNLILASASPRRKKLLENLGLQFEVIPANIDEGNYPAELTAKETAKYISTLKAKHIANNSKGNNIIVSADTIVVLNGKILNKPIDKSDAKTILNKLSNNTHTVYTGVTLINTATGKLIAEVIGTEVTFRKLDEKEIEYYIDSGSPMDKAGAYGIQDDFGAVFVSNIRGCYYNIVGLPLEMFYQMLKEINE